MLILPESGSSVSNCCYSLLEQDSVTTHLSLTNAYYHVVCCFLGWIPMCFKFLEGFLRLLDEPAVCGAEVIIKVRDLPPFEAFP